MASAKGNNDLNKRGDAEGEGPQNVRPELRGLPTALLRQFCLIQRLPLSLIILNAHGSLNVGSLLRAAQLSGVQRIWVVGRRKYDKRSSVGSEHYMDVTRIHSDISSDYLSDVSRADLVETLTEEERRCPVDPHAFVDLLTSEKMCPVFLESAEARQGAKSVAAFDDAVPWRSWSAELPANHELCLVVGNEMTGVPSDLISSAPMPSFVLSIRQLGAIKSHNVAAAGTIVMADFRRYYMRARLGHWVDF